jgi:hypothetical protein
MSEEKPMTATRTMSELKFQFTCHLRHLIAHTQYRLEHAERFGGQSCYAAGYELGKLDAFEEVLKYGRDNIIS